MRATTSNPVYLLVLLGLAGCTHYQAKPLDLPASRQAFTNKSLNDIALRQRLQALRLLNADQVMNPNQVSTNQVSNWDRAQLLVVAAELNPKLLVARAQLQEASAATITARALPNPTLSLGSEYTLSQSTESPWLWSITTDWLLDAGVRRQVRMQLADTAVRAARLDYAEAVWTVRSELRSALLAVLISEQRSALLNAAVTAQETLLRLQRQRAASGEAAATESLPIELELARSRSSLIDAVRQRTAALTQLSKALGLPISAVQQQTFNSQELIHVTELDDAMLAQLRDAALLARTDLERAVMDYQTRELELQQAVKQQYPQLSIGPGYTWDHGVHKATLGVSFSLPIFNRNQGPIAEAQARRTTAGEQVLAVQAQALNEIDSAQQGYRNAVQVLQSTLQQSDAAEASLQLATRELSLGATDQPSVIAARVTLGTQQLSVLDALERMQQALGQLEDALRTPLSGPETTLGKAVFSGSP